jgi:hypothetical protein
MSSLSAVLDACVLIPPALRDTLLRAAAADLYSARWSDDILEEVRRNLVSQMGLTVDGAQRLVAAMRSAFPEAAVAGYQGLIEAMTNHPKDRHVLAVACGAQVIVTSNLRDFPDTALTPHGVEAESPDDFLAHLFDQDAGLMVQIIAEQSQDLPNPPKTVDDVLAMLAHQSPHFAALARATFDQQRSGN